LNILSITVALLIAILTGIGVGGGGLLVLYLTLILNTDQHLAQGINLLFFLISSIASLPVHAARRYIDYKIVFLISAGGAVGAAMGALFTQTVSPELVRKIFGGLLVFSGLFVFIKSKTNISDQTKTDSQR